ncbi:MAG: DUF4926 domain-containing protein [Dehalococcoidia bacterium]|nr:DUF4926 domain-containing protein [Dehalococcoidia bacterium]
MKYKLFDEVALAIDLPEHGLSSGSIGIVVETYPKTDGLEVEFVDHEGRTIAVLTLDLDQVRRLARAEGRPRQV